MHDDEKLHVGFSSAWDAMTSGYVSFHCSIRIGCMHSTWRFGTLLEAFYTGADSIACMIVASISINNKQSAVAFPELHAVILVPLQEVYLKLSTQNSATYIQ